MYNKACLDGELESLLAKATGAGVSTIDGFNEWMVKERAAEPVTEVLQEWRQGSADTRARLRARGLDGELITIVGPYPAGLHAFHLASEAATHADDLDAPVAPKERAERVAWRARFSRFALKEKDPSLAVHSERGQNRLRVGDQEAVLSDEELVEAAAARLPGDHPLSTELRSALRSLA